MKNCIVILTFCGWDQASRRHVCSRAGLSAWRWRKKIYLLTWDLPINFKTHLPAENQPLQSAHWPSLTFCKNDWDRSSPSSTIATSFFSTRTAAKGLSSFSHSHLFFHFAHPVGRKVVVTVDGGPQGKEGRRNWRAPDHCNVLSPTSLPCLLPQSDEHVTKRRSQAATALVECAWSYRF